MRIVVRGHAGTLRRQASFLVSGLAHGAVLAWLAFGAAIGGREAEPRQSIYDMTIRAHERRIVWYHLQDRLPEVRPPRAPRQPRPRPLRATRRFTQAVLAGVTDDARPPRMIWAPAPEVAPPKLQPLPNAIAVAPRPLLKPFVPPPASAVSQAAAMLPDAPQISAKLAPAASVGPALHPLVKKFTPPPEVKIAAAPLPDVPLPDVSAPHPAAAQLAIVGLDPAKAPDIPAPPPPRAAGFSAGPTPQPKGANADGREAAIAVPDLTVRGDALERRPTVVPRPGPPSMRTLLAGVRAAPPPAITSKAPRLAAPPDPFFEGREVFSLAIEMPNVTSFSGDWVVWFAEREKASGQAEVRPPSPLHKVDPKYIASAVEDRVEGKVRLAAVIRKDGRVVSVKLLRRLDDRLDASAMEALAKWQFEPALHNGVPEDVDAVFEIPFRLAPRSAR